MITKVPTPGGLPCGVALSAIDLVAPKAVIPLSAPEHHAHWFICPDGNDGRGAVKRSSMFFLAGRDVGGE